MPPKHTPLIAALIDRMIKGKDHRRVFDLMCARDMKAGKVRGQHVRLRTIDLQRATGHNSDEQRLREIRNCYPDLFIVHHCKYRDRGGFHHEYQLRRGWVEILRGYERGQS
jgi:hypothetical protein